MRRLQPPVPTSAAASAVMRGNRKVDTRPEVRLRAILHRLGYRFRKHLPIDAGDRLVRPDIVFPKARVAVFVDGCFWHRCPEHGNVPRANDTYWRPKLERNVDRDQRIDRMLVEHGWVVLRVWEHDGPEEAAERVTDLLNRISSGRL